MSKTSKSPKKVAQAAYTIAKNTLPDYRHRFSPKKFTQAQLFTCLVLKIFFKTDYRGITEILSDNPTLCKRFNLSTVPLHNFAESITSIIKKSHSRQVA